MRRPDILRLSVFVPEGEPPSEFRIFKVGLTETCYGAYLFDEISAAMVMKTFSEQGNDLMVDYEHKSLDPWAPAGAGKAAGFYRIELRGGECWAVDVRWTPRAGDELRNREWRFFSPAAVIDRESGRIESLINIALTNMPATTRMDPLMASRLLPPTAAPTTAEETIDMSNLGLLAILGLAAAATEKEIADEVTALKSRAADASALQRTLLSTTGAPSVDTAIGIIVGWKEGAARVSTLQARVTELEAEGEKREREALLGAHGRKFTPALKKWAASQSLDALKGFVASAPDLAGFTPERTSPPDDEPANDLGDKRWDQLSASEKHNLHFENPALYTALKAEHAKRKSQAA